MRIKKYYDYRYGKTMYVLQKKVKFLFLEWWSDVICGNVVLAGRWVQEYDGIKIISENGVPVGL